MNQQNNVYIIDHSTRLGHQAIFVINPDKVVRVSIDGSNEFNGYKLITKSGNIYYADDDSTFFVLDSAKAILKEIAKKMLNYSNSESIEILDAENENKILDLST